MTPRPHAVSRTTSRHVTSPATGITRQMPQFARAATPQYPMALRLPLLGLPTASVSAAVRTTRCICRDGVILGGLAGICAHHTRRY